MQTHPQPHPIPSHPTPPPQLLAAIPCALIRIAKTRTPFCFYSFLVVFLDVVAMQVVDSRRKLYSVFMYMYTILIHALIRKLQPFKQP